jgi:hypothetical protein
MTVAGLAESRNQPHAEEVSPESDRLVHVSCGHRQVIYAVILNHAAPFELEKWVSRSRRASIGIG